MDCNMAFKIRQKLNNGLQMFVNTLVNKARPGRQAFGLGTIANSLMLEKMLSAVHSTFTSAQKDECQMQISIKLMLIIIIIIIIKLMLKQS